MYVSCHMICDIIGDEDDDGNYGGGDGDAAAADAGKQTYCYW